MKNQKAAKKDFTEENLPHNRVEMFFDIIKQRYDVLLKIGTLLLLFLLPFLAVNAIGELTYINMLKEGRTAQEEFYTLRQTIALINLGPIAVFGLGLSGIMKIVRNLVWGEPIFFGKDFFSGVRQNRIIFVLVFLIIALIGLLLSYVESLIQNDFVRVIPTAIIIVFFLPIAMYVLSATVVYKDGFLSILKNSIKFFIKSAPVCFLFVLVIGGVFCINLIGLLILRVALTVVAIVAFLPLYLIGWTLYSHSVFDKMVNSTTYPDYVDKGIYRLK